MTSAPPAKTSEGAPLLLHPQLRLSPEPFALLCEANPDAVLERTASGTLLQVTPTGGDTSARNTLLLYALQHDARSQGGWKVFDSSGGFLLPDHSVLSPDVALVRLDCWHSLTPEQRRGFPPLCPDIVLELSSPSDAGPTGANPRGLEALRRKMAAYRANGAQLGWLLIPEQRAVEIWRAPNTSPERLDPPQSLLTDPLLPGLELDLAELWAV